MTAAPHVHLAEILAAMPDLWRRTLGAHSPDAFGRCMACRDLTGSAVWPCLPHQIAESARQIAGSRPPDEQSDGSTRSGVDPAVAGAA